MKYNIGIIGAGIIGNRLALSFDKHPDLTIKSICDLDFSRAEELAGKYKIKGCGHKGEVSFRDGKLPWRFEWPANWGIFNTTFEPFGKEHAEGSWPSGQAIAREIYGFEPPIPHIYEFLLLNGEKMSAHGSKGCLLSQSTTKKTEACFSLVIGSA